VLTINGQNKFIGENLVGVLGGPGPAFGCLGGPVFCKAFLTQTQELQNGVINFASVELDNFDGTLPTSSVTPFTHASTASDQANGVVFFGLGGPAEFEIVLASFTRLPPPVAVPAPPSALDFPA
jgi:hypothetical protein